MLTRVSVSVGHRRSSSGMAGGALGAVRVADTAPGHAAGPSGTAALRSSTRGRSRCLDNIDPSYTALVSLVCFVAH